MLVDVVIRLLTLGRTRPPNNHLGPRVAHRPPNRPGDADSCDSGAGPADSRRRSAAFVPNWLQFAARPSSSQPRTPLPDAARSARRIFAGRLVDGADR